MREIQAVIFAAGKSSRMTIKGSKLLYNFEGKSIIRRVTEACEIPEISKINLIVGHESESIIKELGSDYNYIYQEEQLGTGDAIKCFFESDNLYDGDLFITVADTPLLNKNFVANFINFYTSSDYDTLMTIAEIKSNIPPFARVLRLGDSVISILEDFDCDSEQKNIVEVVTSQYCLQATQIRPFLDSIIKRGRNNNYYFNDLINLQIESGLKVGSYTAKEIREVYGVNDLNDLNFIINRN